MSHLDTMPVAHADPVRREEVKTAKAVANVVYAGPDAVNHRLAELEHEWTVGRVSKVAGGIGIIVGMGLAVVFHIAWIILPITIGFLQLQHALTPHSLLGWALHAVGIRSGKEVEHERITLKALRGDFRNLPVAVDKADMEAMARLEGEGGIFDEPVAPAIENRAAAHKVLETLKN